MEGVGVVVEGVGGGGGGTGILVEGAVGTVVDGVAGAVVDGGTQVGISGSLVEVVVSSSVVVVDMSGGLSIGGVVVVLFVLGTVTATGLETTIVVVSQEKSSFSHQCSATRSAIS